MIANVNGYEVKFNRPKATIALQPRLLGQRIRWLVRPYNSPNAIREGVIIGSWRHPGGGGYFVRLDSGKILQCQSAFKITTPGKEDINKGGAQDGDNRGV